MQHLAEMIRRHYNLNPVELKPRGPVWRVQTTSGSFLLKKMGCPETHLIWLADAIQKLTDGGFNGLTPIIPAKSGLPYVVMQDRNYILTKWHSGVHPSFTLPAHVKQTSDLLGRLHSTSLKTLQPEVKPPDPVDAFRSKLLFLETLEPVVQKAPTSNRIDRSILLWKRHFLRQARFCLDRLVLWQRKHQTKQTLAWGFCHKDPAPHNIIIQNTGWLLIDYELSATDYFITDLVTLIHRVLSLNRWDRSMLNLICEAYAAERALSEEEYSFILTALCFPRKFWRLCSQRFEEKLDWTEKHWQSKFWSLYDEEPRRMAFLKYYFPDLD